MLGHRLVLSGGFIQVKSNFLSSSEESAELRNNTLTRGRRNRRDERKSNEENAPDVFALFCIQTFVEKFDKECIQCLVEKSDK